MDSDDSLLVRPPAQSTRSRAHRLLEALSFSRHFNRNTVRSHSLNSVRSEIDIEVNQPVDRHLSESSLVAVRGSSIEQNSDIESNSHIDIICEDSLEEQGAHYIPASKLRALNAQAESSVADKQSDIEDSSLSDLCEENSVVSIGIQCSLEDFEADATSFDELHDNIITSTPVGKNHRLTFSGGYQSAPELAVILRTHSHSGRPRYSGTDITQKIASANVSVECLSEVESTRQYSPDSLEPPVLQCEVGNSSVGTQYTDPPELECEFENSFEATQFIEQVGGSTLVKDLLKCTWTSQDSLELNRKWLTKDNISQDSGSTGADPESDIGERSFCTPPQVFEYTSDNSLAQLQKDFLPEYPPLADGIGSTHFRPLVEETASIISESFIEEGELSRLVIEETASIESENHTEESEESSAAVEKSDCALSEGSIEETEHFPNPVTVEKVIPPASLMSVKTKVLSKQKYTQFSNNTHMASHSGDRDMSSRQATASHGGVVSTGPQQNVAGNFAPSDETAAKSLHTSRVVDTKPYRPIPSPRPSISKNKDSRAVSDSSKSKQQSRKRASKRKYDGDSGGSDSEASTDSWDEDVDTSEYGDTTDEEDEHEDSSNTGESSGEGYPKDSDSPGDSDDSDDDGDGDDSDRRDPSRKPRRPRRAKRRSARRDRSRDRRDRSRDRR